MNKIKLQKKRYRSENVKSGQCKLQAVWKCYLIFHSIVINYRNSYLEFLRVNKVLFLICIFTLELSSSSV